MSYDIAHDPEKGIHILINPTNGWALGPVAFGPDGDAHIEAFIGALGVDPAEVPDWFLGPRWLDFIAALGAPEIAGEPVAPEHDVPVPEPAPAEVASLNGASPAVVEPVADAAPTAAPDAPPTGPAGTAIDPALVGAPAEQAPAGAPADPAPSSEPGGAAEDPAATAETPGGDPMVAAPGGTVTCPTCDGTGTQVTDGVASVCPTCEGFGTVAAPAAVA